MLGGTKFSDDRPTLRSSPISDDDLPEGYTIAQSRRLRDLLQFSVDCESVQYALVENLGKQVAQLKREFFESDRKLNAALATCDAQGRSLAAIEKAVHESKQPDLRSEICKIMRIRP